MLSELQKTITRNKSHISEVQIGWGELGSLESSFLFSNALTDARDSSLSEVSAMTQMAQKWQLEKSCVVMTKSWLPIHATSRPPSGSLYWEEKINGKSYASPFGLWVLTPRNKLQAPDKHSNDCTCCTGHSLVHLIPTTSRFDLLLSSRNLEMSWESLVKGTVRSIRSWPPKNT